MINRHIIYKWALGDMSCGKPSKKSPKSAFLWVGLKPSPNGLAWFSTNRLMGNHPSIKFLMGTESRNGGCSVAMFEGCLTTRGV